MGSCGGGIGGGGLVGFSGDGGCADGQVASSSRGLGAAEESAEDAAVCALAHLRD